MNEIRHYGMPRKSGRYPWGSGENPYQSSRGFTAHVKELRDQGMTESQIAKALGMNTTDLRAYSSIARAHTRDDDVREALKLKDKGYSNVAIGKKMGINESSVRSLLDPIKAKRSNEVFGTANALADAIKEQGPVDIGVGVEHYMGVSRTKLKTAIAMLEAEGYKVHYMDTVQLGTGKKTTIFALAPPGMEWTEVNDIKNQGKLGVVTKYSKDRGATYEELKPPRNIDSDRIQIRYSDQGGSDKDGVIEVRRGVEDISLGNSQYAQVRVGVDGTHYLKGMVMYSDDIPDGVDIVYNVNKDSTHGKMDVMKKQTDNPDNPFGATYKQRHYINKKGEEELSSLNIIYEEGDWNKWSKALSSQMMSKQRPAVAEKQLELAYDIKKEEYETIKSLTNPVIRKKLLQTFSDGADSDASHLKAAAMPRQSTAVILPINSLKDNEVYAPNYRDGENLVLIRYPHGGIFEIPELVVNNKNREASKVMGQAPDAIGINSKVAGRLSGADFDGDHVVVIPNNQGAIRTSSPLKGLENFDPQEQYKGVGNYKKMTKHATQQQMGNISNLITDMTIQGATNSELARAVRHSMVVIDAEKHGLDYKASEIDNGIKQLKVKYQGGPRGGASTIISRSRSQARVPHREEGEYRTDPKTGKTRKHYIDPDTGEKLYTPTGESYINEQGKEVKRTTRSYKMLETDDAYKLSSGQKIENVYAEHANKLKALGNDARKELINTPNVSRNKSAANTYKDEVASLNAKLNLALKNAPIERQAQIVGRATYIAKLENSPDLDKDQKKRLKFQELDAARRRLGAGKDTIDITDREWEAIQAGAVTNNKLTQIIDNADLDKVKELATPRSDIGISKAKLARAKSMLDRGYTQADIADAIGESISPLSKALAE